MTRIGVTDIVESSWKFYRNSIDPAIGPKTMAAFAVSERNKLVEEIAQWLKSDGWDNAEEIGADIRRNFTL